MRWFGYLAAGLTVAVVIALMRAASVDAAGIAAPLLLLNVVVVARFWGTGPALLAAALSAGGMSYYFLPPAGFEIEEPTDWVAFITFTGTAVIAGELASRAERRAVEAQQGRVEIERLYQELHAAFDRASEAEAARRNEQLKAALLDALTHNLRTPLTSIKAAVTALIGARVWTKHPDLSNEGHRELLQVIDEESDRLNRFIEGLTSVDRPDQTQAQTLRRERLDAIVAAAVTRAENLTRDHRVVATLDPDLPTLSVDAASITEVVYMLIDNASKVLAGGNDDSDSRVGRRRSFHAGHRRGRRTGRARGAARAGVRELLSRAPAGAARSTAGRRRPRPADRAPARGSAGRTDFDQGGGVGTRDRGRAAAAHRVGRAPARVAAGSARGAGRLDGRHEEGTQLNVAGRSRTGVEHGSCRS